MTGITGIMSFNREDSGPHIGPGRGLPERAWRRPAGFLLCFALLSLSAGPVSAEQRAGCPKGSEKYLAAAEAAVDPRVRESLIRKAIRDCPEEPRAYYLLGLHYQALNLRTRAGQAYLSALKHLPVASNVLREIGRLDLANPKEALWNVVGFLIPQDERGSSGAPEVVSLEGLMKKNPQ
ncbi:MAG: hypothetical protein IH939_14385, partial [Acidobacteria bacterium]|nr:hypothetical protein [Acidobacteriota bacterium]